MEANAEAVLADFGADASGFAGRELVDEHVIRADLVLTATRDHRAQVISMGHSAGLRTFTLKEFTRLVKAIDPSTLPDPDADGVVARAHALVHAAALLRGWLLAPSPEADEVSDPYGGPITYFRSIGDEIHQALEPVVTALTGSPPAGDRARPAAAAQGARSRVRPRCASRRPVRASAEPPRSRTAPPRPLPPTCPPAPGAPAATGAVTRRSTGCDPAGASDRAPTYAARPAHAQAG